MSTNDLIDIHPRAFVHPAARLGAGCRVGPFAVIDADVVLGDGCEVGPGVHLTGSLEAGPRNRFHAGAVVGDAPQDLKYDGSPTRVRVGAGNVFREHVTVHRGAGQGGETVIGDGNLFMAGSHVGHDCVVGNQAVLANGALLAGFVQVGDRAFISGNCLVHQFCRVGRLAMMQGGSAISKDLPPFCIARGANRIGGMNTVGLTRAGFSVAQRRVLRRAYHRLFRQGGLQREILAVVRTEFAGEPLVEEWIRFVESAHRGVCRGTPDASSAD